MDKLKTKVAGKIEKLTKIVYEKYNIKIKVIEKYTLGSSRTLGMYEHKTKEINLNEKLLEEFQEIYIDYVVAHEFAHAVVYSRKDKGHYKNKKIMPHGKEFKDVCELFQIEAKASTKLFSSSKYLQEKQRENKIEYKCGCNTHYISKIKHNKIQNKKEYYKCAKCNQRIMRD